MVYLIWILAIISTTGLILSIPTDNVNTSGNVLTLVGICTTLIVGIHFYDAFSIRDINKRTELLNEKIRQFEMLQYRNEIHIKISFGLSQLYYQPYTTFCFLFKGFVMAVDCKDYKCMEQCLGLMEQIPDVIDLLKAQNKTVSEKGKNKISQNLLKQIEDKDVLNSYEKRLDSIILKMSKFT